MLECLDRLGHVRGEGAVPRDPTDRPERARLHLPTGRGQVLPVDQQQGGSPSSRPTIHGYATVKIERPAMMPTHIATMSFAANRIATAANTTDRPADTAPVKTFPRICRVRSMIRASFPRNTNCVTITTIS